MGPFANNQPVIYWHMHCLFEQGDGSFKVLLRDDLLADPVINWAYQHYVSSCSGLISVLSKWGCRSIVAMPGIPNFA